MPFSQLKIISTRAFPTIFFLILVLCSSGQEIERKLLSSSGGHETGVSASLSWSLGEVIVSNNAIGEGFHFPGEFQRMILAVEKKFDSKVKIYPNPTSDFLKIEVGENSDYSVQMTDIQGRILNVIKQGRYYEYDLRMEQIGIYYFSVINLKNQKVETFKIVKQ